MLVFSLGVYASQDTGTDLPDAPGDGPANVLSVVSVGNVPLITLNSFCIAGAISVPAPYFLNVFNFFSRSGDVPFSAR